MENDKSEVRERAVMIYFPLDEEKEFLEEIACVEMRAIVKIVEDFIILEAKEIKCIHSGGGNVIKGTKTMSGVGFHVSLGEV